MFIVGVKDVSPLIITLFSSIITLLIPYSYRNGYDGLLVALGIKPGAYNLDNYGVNTYGLSI